MQLHVTNSRNKSARMGKLNSDRMRCAHRHKFYVVIEQYRTYNDTIKYKDRLVCTYVHKCTMIG